jgi:hypothetical protein
VLSALHVPKPDSLAEARHKAVAGLCCKSHKLPAARIGKGCRVATMPSPEVIGQAAAGRILRNEAWGKSCPQKGGYAHPENLERE